MDIEEFERQEQPRARRSRLEPFQTQIFRLKAKGYANWQVCQWLAANGLKVTPESVRKFVKSREGLPPLSPVAGMPASAPAVPVPAPSTDESLLPANGDAMASTDLRQRREEKASQFIKPKNSLLKHIKKGPSA